MSETKSGHRFVARLKEAWRGLSSGARAVVGAPKGANPDLAEADLPDLRARLADCLEGRGGEARARARAAELGQLYLGLSVAGRKRFMRLLAEEIDIDRAAAIAAAKAAVAAWEGGDAKAVGRAERGLRAALDSPRGRLLAQFTALSDGVKFLIDRRSELLSWSKEDPLFAALAEDLRELFVAWFDLGFLELERITWESPAALLERLAAYEAVHAVRDW
ncbi:MAG: malonyl-CoA decarboxylase N-terminal domain-containing protein, partial [Rhodospirillales bacterium]|nr:malonyl-CoA decarboxylase N-terminal domain-containing protein [Rhodospirillales bacterium]